MAHKIEKDTLIITTKTKTNILVLLGFNLFCIFLWFICDNKTIPILFALCTLLTDFIGFMFLGTWVVTHEGITAKRQKQTLKWHDIKAVKIQGEMGIIFEGEGYSIALYSWFLSDSDFEILQAFVSKHWHGKVMKARVRNEDDLPIDKDLWQEEKDFDIYADVDLDALDVVLNRCEDIKRSVYFRYIFNLLIIPVILFSGGWGLIELSIHFYYPVEDATLMQSFCVGIVVFILTLIFYRCKSQSSQDILITLVLSFCCSFFFAAGLISTLNYTLDFSEPVTRELVIKEKRASAGKKKNYYVEFDYWKEPEQTKEIKIQKQEYLIVKPEESVLVLTTCKGAFGYPWVVEYQIEEGEFASSP